MQQIDSDQFLLPSLNSQTTFTNYSGLLFSTYKQFIHRPRINLCYLQIIILFMKEEVVYQNRIFNIKKKYTLPTQHSQNNNFIHIQHTLHKQNNNNPQQALPKFKHSQYFGKYLDNINKHQILLRRGACDAASKNLYNNMLTHRQSRIKTQSCYPSQNKVSYSSVNHTQTSKIKKTQQKYQRQKRIDSKMSQNLPSLSVRGTCTVNQTILPIKVDSYMKKGFCKPSQQKDESDLKRVKKIMLRKLQVQLINYNLLGKWINSSLKT